MFRRNSGIENFQLKEGENFTVLSKFFVSQDRNEKLCKRTLLFSRRKFLVLNNFLWIRGGISRFSVQIFCLTVLESFVRASYCFWEHFWFRKVLWMKRGVSRFSVENFLSHSTEKLGWGTLRCIRKFRVSKLFKHQRGGLLRFSVEKFLSHSTEKFGWVTLRCIRKTRVSKNLKHQRGGVLRFSVDNFLSHSTEKIRWGTLRCFRRFRVSHNFLHKKGIPLSSVEKFLSHSANKIRRKTFLCFERILVSKIFKQRKASRFCRKYFLSHRTEKNFAKEPFCVSEFFWYGKKLWMRGGGGGYHDFPSNFFVSHDRNEKLCKGILLFSRRNFLVSNKFLWIRGGISPFSVKIFCLTVPKYFVSESYCFWENFCFRKVLWMKRGLSRFSVEIFLAHSTEKFGWGTLRCFINFGFRKILCLWGEYQDFL